MLGDTVISVLHRLIDSSQKDLSVEAAQAILHLKLAESDQARMAELASRSTRNTLTLSETEEYDGYLAAADLLSLWKSKARLCLTRRTPA